MTLGPPAAQNDGRPDASRDAWWQERRRRRDRPGGHRRLFLSLVVALSVGGGVLAGVRLPGAAAAPSVPPVASTATRPTPTPGPSVNAAAIAVCLQIDARLIADREGLKAELAARPFEASNVAAILRGANADLVQASDIAAHLGPTSAALALSRDLSAFYSDLHTMISDGLVNSVQNGPAYLALAKAVAGALAKVERFDARLSALLVADTPPPVAASASARRRLAAPERDAGPRVGPTDGHARPPAIGQRRACPERRPAARQRSGEPGVRGGRGPALGARRGGDRGSLAPGGPDDPCRGRRRGPGRHQRPPARSGPPSRCARADS